MLAALFSFVLTGSMYGGLVSGSSGCYAMQFVTQFVNPLSPLLVSATFCVRQRPQLRSIGSLIYEISEFAAELFGITVYHARSWTSGAGEMARSWHGLVC